MIASVRAALGETAPARTGNAILVTGSTGFIGPRLVAALARKHSVLAPSRAELDLLKAAWAWPDIASGTISGRSFISPTRASTRTRKRPVKP